MMLRFDYIQVLMLAAIPLAAYVKHLNFFSVHHTRSRYYYFVVVVVVVKCWFFLKSKLTD
jgi:hypothetical protein|tara:strand:+ start:146 stop:325 length:180 start_codon:yes stop_codon:yes gene_type:complete